MGKVFWIFVVILLIGGYMIKTGLDTDFGESEDRKNFIWTFAKWVFKMGGNVKDTVGYAVAQDWKPEMSDNNTFIVEEIE
jgi:hypothetical protein